MSTGSTVGCLVVSLSLMLAGCEKKYAEGDCVQSVLDSRVIFRVIREGRISGYSYQYWDSEKGWKAAKSDDSSEFLDRTTVKIVCPFSDREHIVP
jgi:hypothetical protein